MSENIIYSAIVVCQNSDGHYSQIYEMNRTAWHQ